MKSADTHSTRNHGFTLIELVVALTILGVLAVVVSSGLRAGLGAWSRENSEIDEIRSSQMMTSLLRTQIQGALPMLLQQGVDTQRRLSFEGESSKLSFVSRSSFFDGPEVSPRWIELRWESDGRAGRLEAKESRIQNSETPGFETRWQGIVFEGSAFRFEYLSRHLPNATAEWRNAWSSPDLQMPAAVRLSFERRGKRHQIVVRLDYAQDSWDSQWFQ